MAPVVPVREPVPVLVELVLVADPTLLVLLVDPTHPYWPEPALVEQELAAVALVAAVVVVDPMHCFGPDRVHLATKNPDRARVDPTRPWFVLVGGLPSYLWACRRQLVTIHHRANQHHPKHLVLPVARVLESVRQRELVVAELVVAELVVVELVVVELVVAGFDCQLHPSHQLLEVAYPSCCHLARVELPRSLQIWWHRERVGCPNRLADLEDYFPMHPAAHRRRPMHLVLPLQEASPTSADWLPVLPAVSVAFAVVPETILVTVPAWLVPMNLSHLTEAVPRSPLPLRLEPAAVAAVLVAARPVHPMNRLVVEDPSRLLARRDLYL